MSKHKNQHYVPQFYFRFFTDDDLIESYYLGEKKFFTGSIDNLCSRDYFYSKNEKLEKSFSKLEGKWANLLRSIVDEKTFSHFSIHDWIQLRWFLLFQMYRTRRSKDEMKKNIMNLIAQAIRNPFTKNETDLDKAAEKLEEGKLAIEGPYSLTLLKNSYPFGILIEDLYPLILINKTDREFIFSDQPVFIYNSYFHDKRDIGVLGLQNRGIQLFCPLGKNIMLILFDSKCYTASDDNYVLELNKEQDTDKLNKLQVLRSQYNVFFTQDDMKTKIEKYHEDMKEWKKKQTEEVMSKKDEHKNRELIIYSRKVCGYDPDLSFLKREDNIEFELERNQFLAKQSERILNYIENRGVNPLWEESLDDYM